MPIDFFQPIRSHIFPPMDRSGVLMSWRLVKTYPFPDNHFEIINELAKNAAFLYSL